MADMRPIAKALLIAVTFLWLGVPPANADEIAGVARVMGSDRLIVDGTRIHLFGIDGLERRQPCRSGDRLWDCGTAAVRKLQELADQQLVTCVQRDFDEFRRVEAVCRVGDVDLSEAMVGAGMALALRDKVMDYVPAEEVAKLEQAGAWSSQFVEPWTFREVMQGN